MSTPSSRPLRILEVETFGRGGLVHYAHNLSRALASRGHAVTLVSSAAYELDDLAGGPPGFELRKRIGRMTHRYGATWPRFLLSAARKLEALYDAASVAWLAFRLRPDIVHLHCTNPAALAYVACLRALGQTVVSTAHVVTPHEAMRFQRPIYLALHGLARLNIAHSRFDRGRLLNEFGVDPGRIAVIPHGEYSFFERGGRSMDRAAARERLGLEPDDEAVLFFGYIREYKGLDLLLEAWPSVVAERPRARLVIAGDPVQLSAERRGELEDWADRLGAIHRFGYVPFSDVGQYFAAADVLAMPYRHISQSGVLFLALSLGLAVVATRVGGLPEMLDDGESALLVAPESTHELEYALRRALGDGDLRRRIAQGGLQVARRHSWEAIAEETEAAFAALVGEQ